MRILHVLDHSVPLHSGYTFRSLAILREQRALGWETFHLTGPKQGAVDSDIEGAEGLDFYRTVPPAGLFSNIPLLKDQAIISALTRRLVEVAKDVRPDVLHAHSPVLNARATLTAGRKLGIPVVYEVRAFWEDAAAAHGTYPANGLRYNLVKSLETRALQAADAVTTICAGLQSDMVERGVDEGKIALIPNAVDLDAFQTVEAEPALRDSLGLDEAIVLGFIGSFYGYEGLDILLRALPAILQQTAHARLLLVGGGPEENALKKLVGDLDISDSVIFTGRVPHDQVQRYYALVDAFIYPRRNMRLTDLVTPLKPLEAMAQRKAVLASDIGGHRELIEGGVTGTLFPSDNPAALASAVNHWIAVATSKEKMLDEAYTYVAEKRTWRRSVAAYAPVYERLAAPTAKP